MKNPRTSQQQQPSTIRQIDNILLTLTGDLIPGIVAREATRSETLETREVRLLELLRRVARAHGIEVAS